MEQNEFLKSYGKKNDDAKDAADTPAASSSQDTGAQAPSPASSKEPSKKVSAPKEEPKVQQKSVPDVDMNMSFKERDSFKKTERRYGGGGSPYTPPSRQSDYRARTIRNMVIASVATILVAVIAIMLIANGANKVTVQSFVGMSKNDFMLWASEKKVNPQVEEQYNEQVEVDKVVSQSVPEGEKIKKGDFIRVVVSLGPDLKVELPLPDLMNMSKAEIESWAEQNFMSKVRITSETSETVPTGKTIKYQINDDTVVGNTVKRNTPIYITVSKGPPSRTDQEITLPEFKTMSVAEVVAFAQEKGLVLSVNETYDDYIPRGSIITQSQPKDAKVYPGDQISITVSLGKKKVMPSLKGMTKEEVMSKAGELGLRVNLKERYSSSSLGRMIYQSIDTDTILTDDMSLDVTFSLGPKIAVGNYVGQHKHALEQWLETENQKGARLKISTTYTQNASASGTILQQDMKDTYTTRDKTIHIVVSSGNNIFVPDFVDELGTDYTTAITREKANAMNGGKLVLVFEEAANSSYLPGEIWYQSVAAGKELKEGGTVVLKYTPVGSAIAVPDFSGRTDADIRSADPSNADPILKYNWYQRLNITNNASAGASSQSIAAGTMVASGSAIELN